MAYTYTEFVFHNATYNFLDLKLFRVSNIHLKLLNFEIYFLYLLMAFDDVIGCIWLQDSVDKDVPWCSLSSLQF
jgi:hypothetical protein